MPLLTCSMYVLYLCIACGRFLDVSWKFYGFTRGEACVLGMETFPATRTFGAFWLYGGRIVGAFLEVRECL